MIKHLSIALCFAGVAGAQTKTLPPGYVSTDGSGYGYYVGGYEELRAQLITSMLKGSVTVISNIDLRQDGSVYSSSAVARSWSNVTLQVSDSDYAQVSTTFANNATNTPTTVFNGSVNWGALTSRATSSPAPWGTGGRTFAFSSPVIYPGVNDMMLDFTFTGGQLANGGSWGTSLKTYYLDAETYRTQEGGSAGLYGDRNCVPSNSNYTIPDQHVLWNWTYAKNSGNPTTDDKMRFYPGHAFGAISTAHIGAVSGSGVTTTAAGINLGGCQPLMLTGTPILYGFSTSSNGSWSGTSQYIPFNASYVGLYLWGQAAHTDQGTIHLSRVSRSQVRAQPADPKEYVMVYRNNLTSTTGSKSQFGMPVFQLR